MYGSAVSDRAYMPLDIRPPAKTVEYQRLEEEAEEEGGENAEKRAC